VTRSAADRSLPAALRGRDAGKRLSPLYLRSDLSVTQLYAEDRQNPREISAEIFHRELLPATSRALTTARIMASKRPINRDESCANSSKATRAAARFMGGGRSEALGRDVQDGGAAMDAYLEAITVTEPERKTVLRRQLLANCRLDTYAMVRLWQAFAGRHDLHL